MSANDDIQDALTRHQIFVLRYAKGRERSAERAIERAIRQGIERLENVSASGRAIAEQNIVDLNNYLIELNSDYAETFKRELEDFAIYEAGVNAEILGQATNLQLSAPAPVQLKQAIFGNMMAIEPAKGYSIGGILSEFGVSNSLTVQKIAQDAILLGKSNKELTQDILDIIPTQKRKAATLARTITNHTANAARNETMKENADVLDGYKWLSTLDSRTSLVCASRDGTVYPIDDRSPKPPAHFNCRSTITFVVNPEYDLGRDIEGTRPAKGDTKGNVSGDTNYGDWLRKQSPEFQDKVLGPTRGKMFREQGLPISHFVDDQGNTLNLKQLARMDAEFNGVSVAPPVQPQVTPVPKTLRDGYNEAINDYRSRSGVKKFAETQRDHWLRHYTEDIRGRVRHIETIAKEQGFDRLPTVVTKEAFEAIDVPNEYDLYRGVETALGHENLMYGEYWGGVGIYGNGTYAAIKNNYGDSKFGSGVSRNYAGERGWVMRAKLDPEAKVILYDDARKVRKELREALYEQHEKLLADLEERRGLMSFQEYRQAKSKIDNDTIRAASLIEDEGAVAASLGYDAIYVKSEGYVVILNRTALTMSEEVFSMGKGDVVP